MSYSRDGISPTYMSSIFPNGLPQYVPTTTTAPLAAAYTASPYTMSAPTASSYLADPHLTSATGVDTSGLGANALVQQILGASQPIFQQQNRALIDSLANAGIVGGSTAGAQQDLAASQIQQLLGALVPAEQNAQQTMLGAQEFNANNSNNANSMNAEILNNASQYNAGVQNDTGKFNAGLLNSANQYNAGVLNNNSQYNSGILNNNSQYNTGNLVNANNLNASILNNAAGVNTQNALNMGQYDAGTANTILSQILGFQNQDYLQSLNNELSLAQSGETGRTGSFQPVYQQASSPNFSGLSGAFGSVSPSKLPATQDPILQGSASGYYPYG